MTDVDPIVVAAAARRYAGMRQRYRRFLFGGVVGFAAVGTLLFVTGGRLDPVVRNVTQGFLVGAVVVCWLGSAAARGSLNEFRCPRCDKRFNVTLTSSGPARCCKHCGLCLG